MHKIRFWLLNKKTYILISISCLLIMIISILNDMQVFSVIVRYFTEPGYMDLVAESCLVDGTPIPKNFIEFLIRFFRYNIIWEFDYMIIFGAQWFQILIPLFGSYLHICFIKDSIAFTLLKYINPNNIKALF